MRDNFTARTKDKLAQRAGYKCSKPDCRIQTIGADSDDDGTINIGCAAHITAASGGGPRYDPMLTSGERKHHSNGIWLCTNHAKLIDSDVRSFTVEKLRLWKRKAEERSFLEVVSALPRQAQRTLAEDERFRTIAKVLVPCFKLDLSAFKRMPGWPAHPIALNLRMVDGESHHVFTAASLASAIEKYDEIIVISSPGTGKTTTLLQLAKKILDKGSLISGYIPLSEWSTRFDTFFQALAQRAAFRESHVDQIRFLAECGKLVLILDGWNELDEASKRRARNEIISLRRDFPDIRLIVSSRHKDFDIPIDGPVVGVDVLTETQQLEVAMALRGSEGESLMDQAWRTPGLGELVAIPLYLTALLNQATGGSLPTTKEEVLRFFVTELERDPDHSATLREELQDRHTDILVSIAVEATRQNTTALSESDARDVVNRAQKRLQSDNQVFLLRQPMKVIDVLVNAHLLIRPGTNPGGVSFQHQQFQEWFASFWVQHLMRIGAAGDTDEVKTLREDVLNIPVWEETVLFVCDRLSRTDQSGTRAVAWAVLEVLNIDPLFAAEMIYRSSDEVWKLVTVHVLSFTKKWQACGPVDRVVKFMVKTGRAEFSHYIWPLISDPANRTYLSELCSGSRFRVSVLSPDAQQRIATLPEELRRSIVSGIALYGELEGIELAARLANYDESAKVKEEVTGSLLFRRADRFVRKVLRSAPDEVWTNLARKWRPNEIADTQVSARIEKEANDLLLAETDPQRIVNTLLSSDSHKTAIGPRVRELIEEMDFLKRTHQDMSLVHRAYELYPKDVVDALVSRLETGKALPYGIEDLLKTSDKLIDEGPLVERLLHDLGSETEVNIAVTIVGPNTIGILIDRVRAVDVAIKAKKGEFDNEMFDEKYRLFRCISNTQPESFISAVLERANTTDPDEIALLADLVSLHGGNVGQEKRRVDSTTHDDMTSVIQRWAEILLAAPEATRAHFATIAQVTERIASSSLVPVLTKLLSEELARRTLALKELSQAIKNLRHIDNDARISWTLQYRRAFAAIGGDHTIHIMKSYLPDPDFGIDAAHVLKAIWRTSQPKDENKPLRPWPDFSIMKDHYAKRRTETRKKGLEFVNDILAVVDNLIKLDTVTHNDYGHALKLATVAFSMPYVNKSDLIASLLQLPVPAIDKQSVLTVLVLSGETIPVEAVLHGIDELLEDAKTQPWKLQEQDGWRLDSWLSLLPFTEHPGSILGVLDRLKDRYLHPWKLSGLLSALGYAPAAEAENILKELAKRDERFLCDYDWLEAVAKRNTLTAGRILLDLVCSASFASSQGSYDRMYDLGRKLSNFICSYEQLRQEAYEKFADADEGPAKSVLEHVIANVADVDGILLLIRDGAAKNNPFGATKLHAALRHLLIGETPSESDAVHELHSLPAPALRRDLFEIVVGGSEAESRLAAESLSVVDEFRDCYGRVDSEPRHPNIAKGVPWPKINLP